MAPARARTAQDDLKHDAANTKERLAAAGPTSSKIKKNGASNSAAGSSGKDVVTAINNGATVAGPSSASGGTTATDWSSEDLSFLSAYRSVYNLDIPTAFRSPLNAAILSVPGIGRHSPTMTRKSTKKSIPKEQLALTVRKHFNGLAVNETDVVVDFLYKVRFQDKSFKKRFAPSKQK